MHERPQEEAMKSSHSSRNVAGNPDYASLAASVPADPSATKGPVTRQC
jgi:hypothetical protein